MYLEQVEISTDKLVKGMYVCALDRPWLSTSFPFQGFKIRSEREIRQLRSLCRKVVVDVARGVPPESDWVPVGGFGPDAGRLEHRGGTLVRKATPNTENGIPSLSIPCRPGYYGRPRRFNRELPQAAVIHRDLRSATDQALKDIKVGRRLDLKPIRRTLQHMVHSVIRHPDAFVWMTRLRGRSAYAYEHGVRSAVYASVLGRTLGLVENQLNNLALSALLCQIGKARLPRALLEQTQPLTDAQVDRLRTHVDLAVGILDRCVGINDTIVEAVAHHCERFNGSGYPNGLHGEMIPVLSRMVGLVDSYDAMTSQRVHAAHPMSPCQAMESLFESRGVLFQSQLVESFIQALGIYPAGSFVELNTGHVALIQNQATDRRDRLQPSVLLVLDQHKQPMSPYETVDLRRFNERHPGQEVSISRSLPVGEFGLNPVRIMAEQLAARPGWRRLLAV